MKRSFLLLLVFCSVSVYATHNRAGEITLTKIPPCNSNAYHILISTYTKESSNADRCEQTLFIADANGVVKDSIVFPRTNGVSGSCPNNIPMGVSLGNDIKYNTYEGNYTFNGPGVWNVFIVDPNRNAGVLNMTNSSEVPFCVSSMVTISPFLGCNSSPKLDYPPIDNACFCKRFTHNPRADDPDGDSLAYELVACRSSYGVICQGYPIPPAPPASGNVTVDPITGDFVWECPGQQIGEYNFAILIKEYRHGILIGNVTRDLQVTVSGNCPNDPPVIASLPDTCVTAGDFVSFNVTATDPNVGQRITLTSYGSIYSLANSPAQFTQNVQGINSVTGQFNWQTNCLHVHTQPYGVTFRAVDNHPTIPLTDVRTRNITVVAPAPTNLTAVPAGSSMILNWTACVCNEITEYKIYRRLGCYDWDHGICETGIPAYTGYQYIASVPVGTTTYTDNNNGTGLIHGEYYSYRIFAYFGDDSKPSFNSKSYASNQACAKLKKDVPIITNVSVVKTAAGTGKMFIRWLRPTELDTSYHGPFKYLVYRASGTTGVGFSLVDSTGMINSWYDTTYFDQNINTVDQGYNYRIDLYHTPNTPNSRKFLSASHTASSVFLSITPSDNALDLTWNYNVPWTNDSFHVYRRINGAVLFTKIAATTAITYKDTGLLNGISYCYQIESFGHYSDTAIVKPLINWSQEACGVPVDQTPPCAPILAVIPDCEKIKNTLNWNNPNLSCADDVMQYKLYWRPMDTGDMVLISTIDGAGTVTTTHSDQEKSIAGCYYITALDSFANESEPSDTVCVDNCPLYILPNIFTANSDGENDLFHVILPYRYVESIDIKIFNRWGEMVFATTDPNVNWNGLNMNSKKPCTTSVYYYVCTVNEIHLTGIVPRELKGFIHLISDGKTPSGN